MGWELSWTGGQFTLMPSTRSTFISKEKINVVWSQEPDPQSFHFYFQVCVRVTLILAKTCICWDHLGSSCSLTQDIGLRVQGQAEERLHTEWAHQAAKVSQQSVLCTFVPRAPNFKLKIRKRWGQFLRQHHGLAKCKSWGDIVIKAPAGGCVCWQQHSCIAHVWECWEWEIFCNKNPAWAKVQKEERGYRSSLAGDPPGEDLNSKLEATEQSVKGNNQAPTRQK